MEGRRSRTHCWKPPQLETRTLWRTSPTYHKIKQKGSHCPKEQLWRKNEKRRLRTRHPHPCRQRRPLKMRSTKSARVMAHWRQTTKSSMRQAMWLSKAKRTLSFIRRVFQVPRNPFTPQGRHCQCHLKEPDLQFLNTGTLFTRHQQSDCSSVASLHSYIRTRQTGHSNPTKTSDKSMENLAERIQKPSPASLFLGKAMFSPHSLNEGHTDTQTHPSHHIT